MDIVNNCRNNCNLYVYFCLHKKIWRNSWLGSKLICTLHTSPIKKKKKKKKKLLNKRSNLPFELLCMSWFVCRYRLFLRSSILIWLKSGLSLTSSDQQRCISCPNSSLWLWGHSSGRRYGQRPSATRSMISEPQKKRKINTPANKHSPDSELHNSYHT